VNVDKGDDNFKETCTRNVESTWERELIHSERNYLVEARKNNNVLTVNLTEVNSEDGCRIELNNRKSSEGNTFLLNVANSKDMNASYSPELALDGTSFPCTQSTTIHIQTPQSASKGMQIRDFDYAIKVVVDGISLFESLIRFPNDHAKYGVMSLMSYKSKENAHLLMILEDEKLVPKLIIENSVKTYNSKSKIANHNNGMQCPGLNRLFTNMLKT
jgi:hypothetical protein